MGRFVRCTDRGASPTISRSTLSGDERIVISEIAEREDIYDSIKSFLGKGR
jgi:hypothetical protein